MRNIGRASAGIFASVLIIVVIAVAAASGQGMPLTSHRPTSTSSVSQSKGIELNLDVNSSALQVGQRLNVAISIFSTLSKVNTIQTSNIFQFQGVPVALWPACYYELPVEVVVLRGTYNMQELHTLANIPFRYECMEGGSVSSVTFRPLSSISNINGTFCLAVCGPLNATYNLRSNFTTGGYWNLKMLAGELNIPIIGERNPDTPPEYSPFVPGEYTVAVADEWGQSSLLHFTVQSPLVSPTYGAVSFGVPFHYVRNVTFSGAISGALTSCAVLRFPCPSDPTSRAEEFTDGSTIFYAESATACGPPNGCTTWTILIENDSVFCVTPKVQWASLCPSVMNSVYSQ